MRGWMRERRLDRCEPPLQHVQAALDLSIAHWRGRTSASATSATFASATSASATSASATSASATSATSASCTLALSATVFAHHDLQLANRLAADVLLRSTSTFPVMSALFHHRVDRKEERAQRRLRLTLAFLRGARTLLLVAQPPLESSQRRARARSARLQLLTLQLRAQIL